MQAVRSIRGWGVAVCAAAALGGAPGCKKEQSRVVSPEVEPAKAPRPAGARRAAETSAVAVASSPLQLLPDTTVATFHIEGVRSLLAVVDLDSIIGKYRGQYDQLAALVVAGAGVNLLDPAQWREIGVDPDGPIGGAVLDVRSETYAGFIKLSDPDKFRGFLDRIGGARRLQPVMEDRGLVLKSDTDASSALVLRDGFAFLVSTDRPEQAPYDFSRLLATIDPARGLTATARYQKAIAGGEPGRPLRAYIDLWTLVQADQAARAARQSEAMPSWAEQELERAVQSGAPAEDQGRLRQQIDEQRSWERQSAERRQREFELMTRWLAPMGPLVFEFEASQKGVVGKIRAKLPESSPLRAVLRNAAKPSPLITALGERAVVMFGASVDVLAAIASFEDGLRSQGDDPEKLYRGLRDATKLDFKAELAPLLTGEGAFALTIADSVLRGDVREPPGFALALGVKDVTAAKSVVERMVEATGKVAAVKVGKDARTGVHTLAVKDYRTVHTTVVAGQIVVTTDVAVIRNLSTGKPNLKRMAAAVVPVMTARDTSAQAMFDLVFPFVALRGSSNIGATDSLFFQPYAQFPDLAPAQIDRVPQSTQYKAKLRQWQALGARIRKQEEQQERQQMKVMTALADCVGVMAGNLREQPDGVELAGGQLFGAGGLTRAVDLGVEYFSASRNTERTWELYGERSALEEELRRIRVIDVATALQLPVPVQ